MKFTCEQTALLTALSTVTRAIASRSTLDILDCVLFQVEDGAALMTCTDLALGIELRLEVSVQEEGRVALPGKLLHEIVRKMPPGEVVVQVGDSLSARISCASSRMTLAGRPADDFPAIPPVEGPEAATIDADVFKAMVRETTFSAATDETRPILTGCLLQVTGDELLLVAVDGYRLAMRKGKTLARVDADISAVLPARSLTELSRTVEGESLQLQFSKSHMMARWETARVVIRILEGEFIKYQQILPTEWKTRLVVRRNEFDDAIERMALMAREGKNNLVQLKLSDDVLVLTSASELGDARDEMQALIEGASLDIAFNVRFLADVLKNINDECLVFRFQTGLSPCVIVPQEGDAYLYMIVPVRV